jgi:hypothetical protein
MISSSVSVYEGAQIGDLFVRLAIVDRGKRPGLEKRGVMKTRAKTRRGHKAERNNTLFQSTAYLGMGNLASPRSFRHLVGERAQLPR